MSARSSEPPSQPRPEPTAPVSARMATVPFPDSYPSVRARRVCRLLGLLVLALYVLAFPYHPGLASANELCRLWQTRAIAEYGALDSNRVQAEYGAVRDLSIRDGKTYCSKAPLLSVAAVPLYLALEAMGLLQPPPYAARAAQAGRERPRGAEAELALVYGSRLLLTVLPTLFLLYLLRRFLRHYVSAPVTDAVVVTYALGTLGFSYALLFLSHQTTAVLLFSAFYLLWRAFRGERPAWAFVAAGTLGALAVATEYTAALGLVGLGVYVLWECLGDAEAEGLRPWASRLRKLGVVSALATLGALPVLALLGLYHYEAFGHPLHTGYRYLADAAYQPWHEGGLLGVRAPTLRGLLLSLFSPLRGLLTLSPCLMIALGGLGLLRRPTRIVEDRPSARGGNRGLWAMTLALLLVYALFTAGFSYESWGWTTGPRHLTPLVPFLLLPLALALASLRADFSRPSSLWVLGACAGLCAASIVVTGLLSLVNYIPDDVSNALFALALPLFMSGHLPPTAFALAGLTAPWAGAPLVFFVLLAAPLVVWVLLFTPRVANAGALARGVRYPSRSWRELRPAVVLALLAVVLHLGVLRLSFRDTPQDAAALGLLRSVWLTQPGTPVSR